MGYSTWVSSVAAGFVANALFSVFLVVLGGVVFRRWYRNRLLRFFGVKDSRRIVVYVSNLRPTHNENQPSSHDPLWFAVPFSEVHAANHFRELFIYRVPGLRDKPGVLGRLLFGDVLMEVLPAPEDGPFEPSVSVITMGNPRFNGMSRHVQEWENSKARVSQDYTRITITKRADLTDLKCAFVERVVDTDGSRCVFYVAGLTELGTDGAASYLAREWPRLWKKYGADRSFIVALRIRDVEPTVCDFLHEDP